MIEPIGASERLFDKVYNVLRDQILNGELSAGTPLSVPELSRRLGVSRSPVREAVLQLVADGLASSEPRKGASVAAVPIDDLLALHDIREVLEGLSARRAATAMTPAKFAELQGIVDAQARAVASGDAAGYVETDRAFHDCIANAHGEPRLVQHLRVLTDQMRMAASLALADPEHLRRGHAEHLAVLHALAAKAPEQAEAAMRSHIAASRTRAAGRLEFESSAH